MGNKNSGRKRADYVGHVFGRLTVIADDHDVVVGNFTQRMVLVECTCGNKKVVGLYTLTRKQTLSCGCLNKEVHSKRLKKLRKEGLEPRLRHGHTGSKTYNSWLSMRRRCLDPKSVQWRYYGGRGISIDPRWGLFDNFLADMGVRPDGKTLDRIDPDLGYCKANCRWATSKEQRANRRR